MRFKLLHCFGFETALRGTMLSFGKTSFDNFEASKEDIERVAAKLAPMDGGHNAFLEFINYHILVQAPLFWWKQLDRYRHLSQISESTMHKSWKNGLTQEMFETPIFKDTLDRLNDSIREYNSGLTKPDRKKYLESLIIGNLPDAYLQTRLLNVNAKCLRNMYFQRRDHKLKGLWSGEGGFCEFIKNLPYGDLITAERNENG